MKSINPSQTHYYEPIGYSIHSGSTNSGHYITCSYSPSSSSSNNNNNNNNNQNNQNNNQNNNKNNHGTKNNNNNNHHHQNNNSKLNNNNNNNNNTEYFYECNDTKITNNIMWPLQGYTGTCQLTLFRRFA